MAAALPAVTAAFLVASEVSAAEPWVDRRIVLSGNPVGASVDVGFGFGHNDAYVRDYNGLPGASAEVVLGIVKRIDIGFRVGLRWGAESATVQADSYGRPYDSNTFYPFIQGRSYLPRDPLPQFTPTATDADVVSNPEVRVRGKLLDFGVFELGLEGRAWIPIYVDQQFAAAFGVPMALHVAHIFKLDFGAYGIISAQQPDVLVVLDVPANFWFQVTKRVWLGPMSGFRVYGYDPYGSARGAVGDVIAGFGFGISLTRWLDLKGQLVFPRINEGSEYWGTGLAVGFVFE